MLFDSDQLPLREQDIDLTSIPKPSVQRRRKRNNHVGPEDLRLIIPIRNAARDVAWCPVATPPHESTLVQRGLGELVVLPTSVLTALRHHTCGAGKDLQPTSGLSMRRVHR